MSIEAAKGFLVKLTEDKEFAEKLNATQSDEGRLKMAKDFGFDFTNEELKLCVASTGELSDDDLEKVAGGEMMTITVVSTVVAGVIGGGFAIGTTVIGGIVGGIKWPWSKK
ncbi:MAG: Nif11-like leader peptide family RiPP precursor [Synergistaceae bacterium]|nr:Nif11-like leader peptide family RiPP precursor [Synergistaceae bacterium]